jgi:hypothetical protein
VPSICAPATRSLLVATLVVLAAACAPSLSTFQPAHVAPKGHVAASVGIEGGASVGAFTELVDRGKELASRAQSGEPLSSEDKWRIFDAGVGLLLATPSFGPHIAVAYTPLERLEVGLRYAGAAYRLGGRYQLLDHVTGPMDLTVGLGVSRFTYEFPLSDQIPILKLDDFSRWQVDVPLLVGTSRDFFRVWAGPKLLATAFETTLTLTIPSEADKTVARFDGTAFFVGGQVGAAVGYRKLFVAFELTMVEAIGTAHLTSQGLTPPTHDSKISAFTIFPSVGLMGEI